MAVWKASLIGEIVLAASYAPWRLQLLLARLLLAAGLAALVFGFLWHRDAYLWLGALAGGCMFVGLWLLRLVRSRQYGQRIESRHSRLAADHLRGMGFTVRCGQMTRYGDVDMVVSRGPMSATVEIKAFHYWRSRFRDRGRQQRARKQARRQREQLGAQVCVLWLPTARSTWLSRLLDLIMPETQPLVVRGSARKLGVVLDEMAD